MSNQDLYIHNDSDNEEDQYINECSAISSFEFADVRKENRNVQSLGKYDPLRHHRTVYPGLNVEGQCRNQSCKVFEQPVWVKKGYGIFNIAEEINSSECPCCKEEIPSETIKSLGYRTCNVKIEGKKSGDPKKFEWSDKQDSGKLIKFKGYDGKTVSWIFLKIIVSKLS